MLTECSVLRRLASQMCLLGCRNLASPNVASRTRHTFLRPWKLSACASVATSVRLPLESLAGRVCSDSSWASCGISPPCTRNAIQRFEASSYCMGCLPRLLPLSRLPHVTDGALLRHCLRPSATPRCTAAARASGYSFTAEVAAEVPADFPSARGSFVRAAGCFRLSSPRLSTRLAADAPASGPAPPTDGIDYSSTDFLSLTILASFILINMWCFVKAVVHYREFQMSSYSEGVTFRCYVEYRFCEWFRESLDSRVAVLVVIVNSMCIFSALLYACVVKSGSTQGLLRSFAWLVSPDGGIQEATPAGRLVGAVTSLLGVFCFALLVSMITDWFHSKVEAVESSQGSIVESGHTVLLCWTDMSCNIIREVAIAAESEGGTCIAVLDHRPMDELRSIIQRELEDVDMRGSRIVFRSGEALVKSDLEKVAADSARSVILQPDPQFPEQENDAVAMRKVLSLLGHGWPRQGHIVVPVVEEANACLIRQLGGEKVAVINFENLLAQVMLKSVRHVGISGAIRSLFTFDGSEIYVRDIPESVGREFGELTFLSDDAIVVGVQTAAGDLLFPAPLKRVTEANDKVIILAEDDSSYSIVNTPLVDFDDWMARNVLTHKQQHKVHLRTNNPADRVHARDIRENILIVGWSACTISLLGVVALTRARGSTVTVLSTKPIQEREVEIAKWQKDNPHVRLSRVKMKHVVGSPHVRSQVAGVGVAQFHVVFVVAEHVYDSSESRDFSKHAQIRVDGKTLATIMLLQDIASTSMDSNRNRASKPRIIPEILIRDTVDLLHNVGIYDYVDSNSDFSSGLVCVSEVPSLAPIASKYLEEAVFSKLLQDYLPPDITLPSNLSFWDIVCIVRRSSDDIVVGWGLEDTSAKPRWTGGAPLVWDLNPSDKNKPIPWRPGNRIFVLSRPGTEVADHRFWH
eukprot:TRINITY_DN6342_c0_g1_i4.p1 TRINITY_DN6342_c0_g1~~TRINITY_DN6342_c0_g1_i4.p1  ORF type:complete len:919 (+),score=107.00 TRINITY_DN6342_c0_g1_i4:86-2842(+)